MGFMRIPASIQDTSKSVTDVWQHVVEVPPDSIIWICTGVQRPYQWLPGVVFPNSAEADEVLKGVFRELGPDHHPEKKRVLSFVITHREIEKSSDEPIPIFFPFCRKTIASCNERTLSAYFRSFLAFPFEKMHSYFYYTRGYMNRDISECASASDALFLAATEIAASLCNVPHPPSSPTPRELSATTGELRSSPDVRYWHGMDVNVINTNDDDDGDVDGLTTSPASAAPSTSPSASHSATTVDLTSSPSPPAAEFVTPSPRNANSNPSGQLKDDRAYDSDCVPVDPPMDPRGPEAVAKDFEYAKMLSEDGNGDPRGSEDVEKDFRIARELSEAVAQDFECAKMLSEEGKGNPRSWKPGNKKRPTKSRHKKAVHAKFAKYLRPSPTNKSLDSFGIFVDEFHDINVNSTRISANREIANNFRSGMLLAVSAIQKSLLYIKGDSLIRYRSFVFKKFRKYTHALLEIVDCNVQITVDSMSQITRDEHVSELLEGSIRGRGSKTYASVLVFMTDGQLAGPVHIGPLRAPQEQQHPICVGCMLQAMRVLWCWLYLPL